MGKSVHPEGKENILMNREYKIIDSTIDYLTEEGTDRTDISLKAMEAIHDYKELSFVQDRFTFGEYVSKRLLECLTQ